MVHRYATLLYTCRTDCTTCRTPSPTGQSVQKRTNLPYAAKRPAHGQPNLPYTNDYSPPYTVVDNRQLCLSYILAIPYRTELNRGLFLMDSGQSVGYTRGVPVCYSWYFGTFWPNCTKPDSYGPNRGIILMDMCRIGQTDPWCTVGTVAKP